MALNQLLWFYSVFRVALVEFVTRVEVLKAHEREFAPLKKRTKSCRFYECILYAFLRHFSSCLCHFPQKLSLCPIFGYFFEGCRQTDLNRIFNDSTSDNRAVYRDSDFEKQNSGRQMPFHSSGKSKYRHF